jgi:hypothetical protein
MLAPDAARRDGSVQSEDAVMPHWNREGIDPELWIDDDTVLAIRVEALQIHKDGFDMSVSMFVDWDSIRTALAEHDKRTKEPTP